MATGTGTNTSIGVTLQMPLFAGYAIQNRVKETLSLEEKARNDLEAARREWEGRDGQGEMGIGSGVVADAHPGIKPRPPLDEQVRPGLREGLDVLAHGIGGQRHAFHRIADIGNRHARQQIDHRA